jgi:hypothetical protein
MSQRKPMSKREKRIVPETDTIICYDCKTVNPDMKHPCSKCKSLRLGLEWIAVRTYGERWRDVVGPYRKFK